MAIEEINAIKEKCTDKKEQQDLETKLRTLRHYRLAYSQPKIEYEKIKEIATRPIEATNAVDRSILKYKLDRELKILCVSFRQRINNLHDNDKFEIMLVDTYLDNLIEFADHIVRFGYSLFDLIIRCCNGVIISTKHIQRGDISPKFVLFPMLTYGQLLFLLRITKYGKELLKMFGVKINSEIKNNAYGSEHPLVKLRREQISIVDSIIQRERDHTPY